MTAFDAYIFDLDGTIYLGEELLPGAQRLIEELRAQGKVVRFLSNNPTKSPADYVDKLTRLGIPTPLSDIANTVVTASRWLAEHEPEAVIYPIAEQPVTDALDAMGLTVSDDPSRIDIVLASYDRTFTYEKLQIAFDALWFHRRARLMATNLDKYCPFPGGRGEPDAAGIVAAIEATTGARCERNFGKPDATMVESVLSGIGVLPHRAIMVGDRLATDIALARNAGLASALVLTGDSSVADVADLPIGARPDFILENVGELLDLPVRN